MRNCRCEALCIVLLVVGCMGGSGSLSCLSDRGASKNGGNCTFDVSLCGWRSDHIKDGEWTVKGSVAQLQWISIRRNVKASMTSPELCETSSETACLRMRYKINSSGSGRGRKLYIERCNHSCKTLWSTNRGTADQWQTINVSVDTSGPFTIRITGEKSSGDPQIYVDDVTYTNTPCNQTRNTRSLNGTTTTSNGPDSSTRPTLSGHGTDITPTTQGPTQEAALEVESSHDAGDNAVTTGIAAAVVAIAMVIAAVAVVARYYINRGCCNRSLLRKKPSIPKYTDKNPPITASNQLYNIVGYNHNKRGPSLEIHSIQQLPAAEPEVNIYSDIEYIDTTFPRRNQGSLMASADPYWVSEPVQTSSLVAMMSSMQSEPTEEETIYQNTDTKEHSGKEFDQDASYRTPCEGEMKMERVYQNVDTSL